MGRTFYGYWTCTYCGRESRGDVARCPGCGKTRSRDVVFYPDPKGDSAPRVYVEGYESKGADWLCAYCDSLNSAADASCRNCGHTRDESDQHYHQLHPERQGVLHDEPAPAPKTAARPQTQASPSPRKRGLLFAAIALIVVLLVCLFLPKTRSLTVTDKQWARSVTIEEYRTVREEDWSIPAGGRKVGSFQAIHHYIQVLDHYETVTRSRQVEDGGHWESYGYRDNGDGTFTEESRWVTDYRTEYYTVEEPVYVSVPVYETKYSYDIERWVFDHAEQTSGHADEPYFADPPLTEKYRKNGTDESYSITAERRSLFSRDPVPTQYSVDYDDWRDIAIGDTINARIRFGNRLELIRGD